MNFTRIIICLSLFFNGVFAIQAQPPMGNFTVKGKIVEFESEQPLEYVSVALFSMRDSSLVTGTITRSDGSFEISTRRPGMYFISADFIGYQRQYIDKIELNPASPVVNVGKIIKKHSKLGIEEIEVVGERPFVSYQIDKKVIDVSRNPLAQGGTAVEALENVPSIDTDIEGNVALRGSSEFTVLIDGRQSPIAGSDALKQIPASAIDKIEIITNPSVKYDPDGTAGIINVITKKGKLKGHSLVLNTSIGTSPMGSANLNYTYRMKKATLYTGVSYRNYYRQFESRDYRTTVDSSNQESYINTLRDGYMQHGSISVKGGLDYFLSEANTFSVGGSFNSFTFGRSFDSRINSISTTTSYQVSHTDYKVKPNTFQLNVGDKHIFNNNRDHFLSLDFMYQSRKGDAEDELFVSNATSDWVEIKDTFQIREKALTTEDARRMRLEINYSWPVSDALNIEAGYTMRMDRSDKDYTRFLYINQSGGYIPNNEFDDKSVYTRDIHAFWGLAKGELYGLGYSFGLRLEGTDRLTSTEREGNDYKYKNFDYYPSAALSKEWASGHTLQANYSRRINRPRDWHLNPFPTLSDGYTAFIPNPDLKPEYASAVELNYQKSWGRQFLAVETFFRHTVNEFERVLITIDDTLLARKMINLGMEQALGSELGGNVRLTKWWDINPVATIYYYKKEGEYNNKKTTVTGTSSRFSLTNNFSVSSKTRVQFMGNYRGPSVSLDGDREETYWFSAAIRQTFLDRKLSAVFRVDDIFNTRRRAGTSVTENLETKSTTTTYSEGFRKGPVFVLSLSLNINQKSDRKSNRRNESEMDGGGMDMEF